jgi:WD40 repeat protein
MYGEPAVFQAHSSYVIDLLFTPDGKTLISAGMDNIVKLWSVPDWHAVDTWEGHEKSVNTLALSPDGGTLATGSTDATVKLWSFPEGKVLHTLTDRKKTVAHVCMRADGVQWAAGWYGGRATVWTLDGQEVVGVRASKKNLSAVAFCAGDVLATAGLGDDIALWSLPTGDPLGTLSGHRIAVLALAAIDEGRTLVSLGYEQAIRFWEVKSGQMVRSHVLAGTGARAMRFSPDERTLALGLEGRVQLWSVADWALRAELPVGTKALYGSAFSPDGRWLAVGAADGKIRVWALA